MDKKFFFALTLCVICAAIAAARLHAQPQPVGAPQESVATADIYKQLDRLSSRIDGMSLDIQKSDKELKAQLQEIMNTQQLILKELAIIKVRSTR